MDYTVSSGFQEPLKLPDFDKKVLKKGFRKIGQEVRKESRKLVSSRAISRSLSGKSGFPSRRSGLLRKTISYRVSKSGHSVAIGHFNWPKGVEFYPAFVMYGHRAPKSDMKNGVKDKRQKGRKRVGKKVASPRENWIVAAAERYGESKYLATLSALLDDALKPGLIESAIKK